MPSAVLVIDDHPLFRDGLSPLVDQLLPGADILSADDAAAGLALAQTRPDIALVLIDHYLPRMNGVTAIPLVRMALPGVPVVMVSSSEQVCDARAALAAGARGFVPKSAKPQVILNALRMVIDGSVYVPPLMLDDLSSMIGGAAQASSGALDEYGLTQRQRQVLGRLCAGQSNKEIAQGLNLAENTVKVHVGAIFKALGVMSRTQAIVAARERGIVA